MTPSTRVLVATAMLLAGLTAWSSAAAQAPAAGTSGAPGLPPRAASTPPRSAKATGVISGRILAADTGLPLRRASVTVYGTGPNLPSDQGARRATITDAEGAFTFTDLPAGRYQLQASKAGYVDTEYGARATGLVRPIEVAEGQKVENITVSLPRAGVIVGRVVDELGEPVADALVEPMQAFDDSQGTRLWSVGTLDRTNDIGAYRLYGLPPGTYYVSAQSDDPARSGIAMAGNTPGFAPTFFPDTADAAEAQAIEVVAGGEAVADIAMVSVRLSTVSGVVLNTAGALATGGSISAQPTMRVASPQIEAAIQPDGSFALSGLAPGEYTVRARPSFEPRGPSPSPGEMAINHRSLSTSVVVTGKPVGGLRLVLPDPIRIPVALTFEGATGRPPEQVSVSAHSERTGIGESASRGADGRLTLELSAGTWQFMAHAPAPWIVKRLAYRGEEIDWMDEIEVADQPGGSLEVVFTTKTATVTGSVKDATGRPVADYIVWFATAKGDLSDPAIANTFIMATPDQTGRFKVDRLRPGMYVFVATRESSPGEPGDGPTELRERGRKTGAVLLRENETATVELTLPPRP
jgi:protocatechuate 3,4-dioxygenase beta subunit